MSSNPAACSLEAPADGLPGLYRRLHLNHPYTLSAVLELTHQCNLRCPHCYVGAAPPGRELDTGEVIAVLEQLRDMGVLLLSVTGGEPTVRGDFSAIIDAALANRFVVTLKTNAVRLTPREVRRLAEKGLYELNVSLYHIAPAHHDAFVGLAGAHARLIDAARAFKAAGGNVRVSVMVMDWNCDAIPEIESLCEREGWPYTVDFRIEPRTDGDPSPLGLRAKPAKLRQLCLGSAYIRDALSRSRPAPDPGAVLCGAARGLVVRPDGDVVPCVAMPWFRLGNVREMGLREIWHASRQSRERLEVRWADHLGCVDCRLRPDCKRCLATAFGEHGDLKRPASMDCELAEVWRDARERLEGDGS